MEKFKAIKNFSTVDKNLLIIEDEIIYGQKTVRYDGMLLYDPKTREYLGEIIHPNDFMIKVK